MARLMVNTTDHIERSTQTIHTVRVDLTPMVGDSIDAGDEIHLVVNGRVIKRCTKWQAERLGLITPDAGESY